MSEDDIIIRDCTKVERRRGEEEGRKKGREGSGLGTYTHNVNSTHVGLLALLLRGAH